MELVASACAMGSGFPRLAKPGRLAALLLWLLATSWACRGRRPTPPRAREESSMLLVWKEGQEPQDE